MSTLHDPPTCPTPMFLGPGEGPAIHMGSLPVVFKALSAWSGGAYEMPEQRLPPGVLVAAPPALPPLNPGFHRPRGQLPVAAPPGPARAVERRARGVPVPGGQLPGP